MYVILINIRCVFVIFMSTCAGWEKIVVGGSQNNETINEN